MITGEKRKALFGKKDKIARAEQAIAAQEMQAREGDFYEELLEFAVSLANKLQACGAETYRVEETINRIVAAYGVERVDAFVIPSSIMASLETDGGQIITKIRRLKNSETMLDGIERYTALSRRICTEKLFNTALKLFKLGIRRNGIFADIDKSTTKLCEAANTSRYSS